VHQRIGASAEGGQARLTAWRAKVVACPASADCSRPSTAATTTSARFTGTARSYTPVSSTNSAVTTSSVPNTVASTRTRETGAAVSGRPGLSLTLTPAMPGRYL